MARPLRIKYEGAFYHIAHTTYFNVKRQRSGHLFQKRSCNLT